MDLDKSDDVRLISDPRVKHIKVRDYDSLQPAADEDPVSDLVFIPVVDQESHWLICEILLKKSKWEIKWTARR